MENKERFTNRVAAYITSRPGYPDSGIDWIIEQSHISTNSIIADIGAGTGISSKYFTEKGYKVFGIEPNEAMRQASITYVNHPRYEAIAGDDTNTGLAENSVDLIISAQAFHWFDSQKFKKECARILKPLGHVAILWNDRTEDDHLQKAYTKLIDDFNIDYYKVSQLNFEDQHLKEFYFPEKMTKKNVFERPKIKLRGVH
jgi:SAM-dependent methyltransferase